MKNLADLKKTLTIAQDQADALLNEALDNGTAQDRIIARKVFRAVQDARIEATRLVPLN